MSNDIPKSFLEKTFAWLRDMYDMMVANLTLQETGGTLTSTAAEQNLYINNAPLGVFKARYLKVNLDNMAAGDAILIREYQRINSAGNLELIDSEPYSGADGGLTDSIKVIVIDLSDSRFGHKVTLIRTAGVDRDYVWEYFEEA